MTGFRQFARGGRLLAALALTVAAASPSAARDTADSVAQWRPLIAEAAARFALPPDWIARVMRAESAGRTHRNGRPIRSHAGAMGLMQLMPATWAEMRSIYDLGRDPDNPRANIMAGAAYLRLMYDRFGYPGLFAAYNAGPGRYAAYLAGTRELPGETRAYLASVTGTTGAAMFGMRTSNETHAKTPGQRLFLLHYDGGDEATLDANSRAPSDIFAIKRPLP